MVDCLSESEFDREQTNINLTTKWVVTTNRPKVVAQPELVFLAAF